MSPRVSDHDLTVLVETAAAGMWDSKAAHEGGPVFADLPRQVRNSIREAALPYVFHATKALQELGYTKPRLVATVEELAALPFESVIRDAEGHVLERWGEPEENLWATVMVGAYIPRGDIALPATVLYEVTA